MAAREQKEVYFGNKDKVREMGVGGVLELQASQDARKVQDRARPSKQSSSGGKGRRVATSSLPMWSRLPGSLREPAPNSPCTPVRKPALGQCQQFMTVSSSPVFPSSLSFPYVYYSTAAFFQLCSTEFL